MKPRVNVVQVMCRHLVYQPVFSNIKSNTVSVVVPSTLD